MICWCLATFAYLAPISEPSEASTKKTYGKRQTTTQDWGDGDDSSPDEYEDEQTKSSVDDGHDTPDEYDYDSNSGPVIILTFSNFTNLSLNMPLVIIMYWPYISLFRTSGNKQTLNLMKIGLWFY